MKATPFFSVVIPLYNKEEYIEDTLKSVFNQTFQDFEIIVVNDGSTDGSLIRVNTFNDNKISVIQQENLGLSAARNTGIRNAKAEYIAFLDADDLWYENYLDTQYNLVQNHKSEFIFATDIELFSSEKPILKPKAYNTDFESVITNYFALQKNIFGPSSLVTRKGIFNKVGYFNESITYGEGDEFFIKCFSEHNLIYYSEPMVFYRVGIENQLTAPNKKSNRIIPDYEVYLKGNNNNDLKKYIDFIHYKLVVLYKMEKNYKLVNFYKRKIDTANLSLIQKIKFHLPTNLFYISKSLFLWFSKRFTHS